MMVSSAAMFRSTYSLLCLALFVGSCSAFAFRPTHGPTCNVKVLPGAGPHSSSASSSSTSLSMSSNPDNNNGDDEDDGSNNVLSRFVAPRIDDIGLPIADAMVAQVVAPSFQILAISLTRTPIPTWLRPGTDILFPTRGSLLAPTLIHGAGLATCWVLGALAARAFESEAFDVSGGKGYGEPIARTLKAGAFATGCLILATQIDLQNEFGGYVQLGYSDGTDVRIAQALDEVLKDIVFEASTLFGWRMYRSSLTSQRDEAE
mmetsp:Transcript_10573/g.29719  ORF Transcript_10573/g.29719 Transcript_10573/m.29719 type:complete len:261 (-) Transcript_10573:227-1009(-)